LYLYFSLSTPPFPLLFSLTQLLSSPEDILSSIFIPFQLLSCWLICTYCLLVSSICLWVFSFLHFYIFHFHLLSVFTVSISISDSFLCGIVAYIPWTQEPDKLKIHLLSFSIGSTLPFSQLHFFPIITPYKHRKVRHIILLSFFYFSFIFLQKIFSVIYPFLYQKVKYDCFFMFCYFLALYMGIFALCGLGSGERGKEDRRKPRIGGMPHIYRAFFISI